MLNYLEGKTSERQWRLFGCACCRRIWHLLGDEGSRRVVEVAERRADGEVSSEEIRDGMKQANVGNIQAIAAMISSGSRDQTALRAKEAVLYTLQPNTASAVRITIKCAAEAVASPQGGVHDRSECSGPALMAEKQAQATVLRDVVGNPFRPITLVDPSWLGWNGGTVVKLAQGIYDDRAFDRLPILADALEEAGCNEPNILDHCRASNQHVRGCWVVDLLRGKK